MLYCDSTVEDLLTSGVSSSASAKPVKVAHKAPRQARACENS